MKQLTSFKSLMLVITGFMSLSCGHRSLKNYPSHWWKEYPKSEAPAWEILPHEAKKGEVILSKRNELGILSNFAHTPFVYDGENYQSIEGFWQMMLYPEDLKDPRHNDPRVKWEHTRKEVQSMVGFEAKRAGSKAKENMKILGIDWVTYRGERFLYRIQTQGRHYELIINAMRAKLDQNPKVQEILLKTGDLILMPDHITDPDAPPEWKYNKIWMDFRAELKKSRQ
jgi:predicted NAD-dependent protein-ADP-ribosyltransferase YbiA (DUF1768 family)